jgi:hypothetical protein
VEAGSVSATELICRLFRSVARLIRASIGFRATRDSEENACLFLCASIGHECILQIHREIINQNHDTWLCQV